jgi:hypothetical protein
MEDNFVSSNEFFKVHQDKQKKYKKIIMPPIRIQRQDMYTTQINRRKNKVTAQIYRGSASKLSVQYN